MSKGKNALLIAQAKSCLTLGLESSFLCHITRSRTLYEQGSVAAGVHVIKLSALDGRFAQLLRRTKTGAFQPLASMHA